MCNGAREGGRAGERKGLALLASGTQEQPLSRNMSQAFRVEKQTGWVVSLFMRVISIFIGARCCVYKGVDTGCASKTKIPGER